MAAPSTQLLRYDAARHALAAAHKVDEAKAIRDKALALAAYARQANDQDMIAWATEIKTRAERRTGELLRETAVNGTRQKAGDNRKTSSRDDVSTAPTLANLGITRDQSSDWQKLAAIPEKEFESRLSAALENPRTLTTSRLLRPAAAAPIKNPWEAESRVWAGVSEWLRRSRELPDHAGLTSVKPTGGSRDAIRGHLVVARQYMATLAKLRKRGWI